MDANELTKYIIDKGQKMGFNLWRNSNHGIYNEKTGHWRKQSMRKLGVGDIIGYRKSDCKHTEIEVKVEKDKINDDQRAHLMELHNDGCIAVVIRNEGGADKFFKRFKA